MCEDQCGEFVCGYWGLRGSFKYCIFLDMLKVFAKIPLGI